MINKNYKEVKISNMKYKVTKKINKDIITEIVKVEKEMGLTPENLVSVASRKDNPLHDFFDWDDTSAGEKWRLQQARVLINEVKVKVEDKTLYAYENVSVKVGNTTQRVYKSVNEIMSSATLRKQILKGALAQLEYWGQKYEQYEEFHPIIHTIKKVKRRLENGNRRKN